MKKLFLFVIALVIAGVGFKMYSDGMQSLNSGAGSDDPRVTAAWTMLIGTWSSEDDRNLQREYRTDGIMVDTYGSVDGAVSTEASWALFTADTAEPVDFQLNNHDVYIRQVEEDGVAMHFRIGSVTPEALELVGMDTAGDVLRFGKMTTGQELQDGQEDLLSASFRCDNDSSFVAEFSPSMDEVTISSEEESNTFAQAEATIGVAYGSETWTFAFQGETASVTDKTTETTTTCTQVLNPDAAPMHFGE